MKSLRVRLLFAMLAILAATALLMGALTYRNVLAETEALFDYQLQQMALSLRDQGEIASEQAGPLADEQLDFVIQIWSVDGRAIYASRPHSELPARALLGLADVSAGGRTWRTFSVATRSRVIQVAQPEQIRQRLAAASALHTVSPLVLVAPLMGLVVWWLAAAALKPLHRVAADVQQRDEQSLAPLAAQGLPDEVAPLVIALNALLARLDASLGVQRAFVADAAHELRSPLTALKLQLEVLRRSASAEERESAGRSLGAGIDRAARLVEQLLVLARTEPGAKAVPFTPVDLNEITRQAIAETVSFARTRNTELELDADAPATIDGDAAALGAMVRNLVDNAVRYSPRGARVHVRVGDERGAPTLEVNDAGPGIASADRERVFDRFYRRATDEPGSGLGLAIVRGVATSHGAEVTLGESPLGGLRVSVRFDRKSRHANA